MIKRIISILVLSFAVSGQAQAEKYVGLIGFKSFLGVNMELVRDFGSAYVVLGMNESLGGRDFEDMTFLMGARRYLEGRHLEDNYFAGLVIGDLDGTSNYNRYGAGLELGHQWMGEHLRSTASVNFTLVGESSEATAPQDVEPAVFFSFSVNLKR